jgi:hypothetical protein
MRCGNALTFSTRCIGAGDVTDRLEVARRLSALGFSVIPVGPDKRPTISWLAFQQARATDDNLLSWFGNGQDRNIGIVTGRISSIVVVDTDNEEAEGWAHANLPATPMMCKTAKGMHRYYRHPGTEVRNGARISTDIGTIALDVRGDGGYVVAPGSVHPSGVTYAAPTKWPTTLEDVPVFSAAWLAGPSKPIISAPTTGEQIPSGQRNATLTSLAGAMQRRGMSEAAILAALQVENDAKCNPPLDSRELSTIVKSVGRYEPNAVPALRSLTLLSDVELLNQTPPAAVIDDRVFTSTLVSLYGPPGVGKTFLAQDLAYCVASGEPWLGATVERSGAAIYIAAEGAGGLTLRVRAWKTHHGLPLDLPVGVWTIPTAINLMELSETQRLLDAIRPLSPQLIVFDTLARCLVGGDENSAKDMGLMVQHCDLLRTELAAVVVLVHHTQKNGPTERGSGALRGACDTMLELTSTDDLLMLSCDKQKDAAPFRAVSLTLHAIRGTDSCVVQLATSQGQSLMLTHGERRALIALREQFSSEGARSGDWLKAAQIAERSFYRTQKRLEDLGYVRKEAGRYVWTGKRAFDE